MVEDRRLFDITEDWSIAALDPEVWYSTVREGDCRFMAARVKEEEKNVQTPPGEERSGRGGQG